MLKTIQFFKPTANTQNVKGFCVERNCCQNNVDISGFFCNNLIILTLLICFIKKLIDQKVVLCHTLYRE